MKPTLAWGWTAALACSAALLLLWLLHASDPREGPSGRSPDPVPSGVDGGAVVDGDPPERRGPRGAERVPLLASSGDDPARARGDGTEPGAARAGQETARGARIDDPAAVLSRVQVRFQSRWGRPGLCGPEGAGRVGARAALLGTFVPLDQDSPPVLHAPGVDPGILAEVRSALGRAITEVRRLGLEPIPPPAVYVYTDAAQLLAVSCVNQAAAGYYDGAIHLSGNVRNGARYVNETVVHEYVHHVLLHLGVRLPTWLQEGLAMHVAGETWWRGTSSGLAPWLPMGPLPLEAMVRAFPDGADEPFALSVYSQSALMVELVRRRRGDATLVALVQALARGEVSADHAFAWALGSSPEALARAWAEALASPPAR